VPPLPGTPRPATTRPPGARSARPVSESGTGGRAPEPVAASLLQRVFGASRLLRIPPAPTPLNSAPGTRLPSAAYRAATRGPRGSALPPAPAAAVVPPSRARTDLMPPRPAPVTWAPGQSIVESPWNIPPTPAALPPLPAAVPVSPAGKPAAANALPVEDDADVVTESLEIEPPLTANDNPSETPQPDANGPFTGVTISIASQSAVAHPDVSAAPLIPRRKPASAEQVRAMLDRIRQRSGLVGLRGFCPVTLREECRLADTRPEFHATWDGRSCFFASASAVEKFLAEPELYAPQAAGADVVVLVDEGEIQDGSLEHAVWYCDRLFLFTSKDSVRTFVANQDRYIDQY